MNRSLFSIKPKYVLQLKKHEKGITLETLAANSRPLRSHPFQEHHGVNCLVKGTITLITVR